MTLIAVGFHQLVANVNRVHKVFDLRAFGDILLDLVDELGIDSMDLATIALVLQDEYKITIDEDDYPKLKTIRLIADYIEEKLASKN